MKRIKIIMFLAGIFCMMDTHNLPAYEHRHQKEGQKQEQDQQKEPIQQLGDVVVEEKAGAPGFELSPSKTVIDVQDFPTVSVPNSIVDVLKTQAIVDFRGESDIDPGVDSVFLRGFDATRFVTALDGLTLQKTGGRKSSNIVDYALLPAFVIDTLEILPGPHSALYDSKSIGGVLTIKTRKPERRQTLKPESRLMTSYGSYDTRTHNLGVQGAVQAVTYDLNWQKHASDGYLRTNAIDTETVFGRVGLVLPSDGFLTLSASYSEVDREAPVTNTGSDYDPDYPEVETAAFSPWQKPTWDGRSYAYRFDYEQNSPIGRLSVGAYYSKDNRDRAYFSQAGDTEPTHMDTDWWQQGGKIQDEIRWSQNHVTTLGFDTARLYDNGVNDEKTERIEKNGGFLQHQWAILPSVDVRLGLRYEDVAIKVTNNGAISGREDIIERDWDDVIPKSFITWKMDHLAAGLRDTSLSVGISKIWRAPDYHGDYNPQGRPAGAWLDPEHGIGYDLVFNRRLWRDINLLINYSFYRIDDYIASNSAYALYSGPGAGSLRYSDYKINLKEVHRHGVDLGLGGHLTDGLSFYMTYAWQKFDNQSDEPAGETELHKRAEHRVTAGLAYALFENTRLLLDYYYQSKEVTEISEEIEPDVWFFTEEPNDAYSLFDVGIQHVLFESGHLLREACLRVYVKNIFDEEYRNSSGFPATDRTYGAALNVSF